MSGSEDAYEAKFESLHKLIVGLDLTAWLDPQVLELLMGQLEPYTPEQVHNATSHLLLTSQYPPKPADLIKALQQFGVLSRRKISMTDDEWEQLAWRYDQDELGLDDQEYAAYCAQYMEDNGEPYVPPLLR